MTTDRTASARPAALAERPNNGPRKHDPAPDVFAQILGGKSPADAPKRPDAPRQDAPKPKADAKDKPAGDAKKPAADKPTAAADPAQTVAPDPVTQPVVPTEPLPATANQLVAQLASPLPAPVQPQPETPTPIQAPVNAVPAAIAAPAQPAVPAQPVAQPEQNVPQAQPATQAPTEQTTAPAVPTADTPATPIKTDDIKLAQAPAVAAPHTQPQQAAQPGAQAQPNAGDSGHQQPSQSQPEQTAAPAPTPGTTHVADAPKAEAPAQPQPAQAPAPAAQPTATAAPERAVPLYRAPHTAAAVIHLAQQHGVTHARINLKPAELGGIEVRLHSTPQGIAAHLIADSPEAAKALSQASDDLRRQLESRDVNLLSLDVSTSNGDDGRQAGFGADAGREGSASTPSRTGFGLAGDETPEAPAETTLVLPDGVLVDVLA